MIASAAFALYVAYFASYNKTYGSLAGIIVFLIWLWITNLAILLGAEVNAELEHERALDEGLPADTDSFVIPRDTAKLDDEQTRAAGRPCAPGKRRQLRVTAPTDPAPQRTGELR